MDIRNGIDLQECPLCGGAGILEIEQDWCVNISCLDCGCQTADVAYKKPEDKDA
ncbi:MAG: Lar family restriction alleviation protein, partial [Oscillospiraceae bacterium]|nr:Lar family restriction alleviation protein [Oscillospiraceae bacterium]